MGILLMQISYIWPKSPQNKFLFVLISHAQATRPCPCSSPMAYSTAMLHGDLSPGLWAFLASVSIEGLIKSPWVGRSKIWRHTSCPYSIIATCGGVKVHVKMHFFKFSWFSFYMQNTHEKYTKLAPYENFPLYGITCYNKTQNANFFISINTVHLLWLTLMNVNNVKFPDLQQG